MRSQALTAGLLATLWLSAAARAAQEAPKGDATEPATRFLKGQALRCGVDAQSGALRHLEGQVGEARRAWLMEPVRVEVRNEVTGVTAEASGAQVAASPEALAVQRAFPKLSLAVEERWTATPGGLAWDLAFRGTGERVGHEVVLDLPVLSADSHVFTPGERGVMSVAAYPSFRPVPYAAVGWGSGQSYVLPLVSVFDGARGCALTVALPPDANIPHLRVEWLAAKTLRLRLAHRGMGAGPPTALRLLFYTHPADYRCVLKAYSDDFPRYFRPGLPRGAHEGAFWYHHIHNHPDFDEMARQDVRFIWSSFWFTHLGEYLPAEKEWEPYTFARWWKLGEPMSDAKIRAFARTMHEHGIGTFAYLNVTEYGGHGGKGGDPAEANRRLREQFANALFRGANGQPVPTWEGAMAMNPGAGYALRPCLREQVRRHLERLPEIDGFVIDRLDWASRLDYGHSDGLTMVSDRAAENMAVPVGDAVQEICATAHAAGKRVYVNQLYRVEVLRDVDGTCHENDYVRGLGYLSPFRPASAWHHRKPYRGDLLQFEAQLKRRLQFALFPQMIAHEFPISQQGPDPEAADLLEVYAPLFSTLHGKEQVLLPHCVSVTGANDANLFVNGAGHYVVPVTSRVRFLSRESGTREAATVSLRVPDAAELKWAHVCSADEPPYRATVSAKAGAAEVMVSRHGTASVVVVGKGAEPALAASAAAEAARRRLFPELHTSAPPAAERPSLAGVAATLAVSGVHVGEPGPVVLLAGGTKIGEVSEGVSKTPLALGWRELPAEPPEVALTTSDEGTWFALQRARLLVRLESGKSYGVAEWTPECGAEAASRPGELRVRLRWCEPQEVVPSTARFAGRDGRTQGNWTGKMGSAAAWIPNVAAEPKQNGYELRVLGGQAFTWAAATDDPRVLKPPKGTAGRRRSTCWFESDAVSLSLTPPDRNPFRLTVYLLDYDRNGRAVEVRVSDDAGVLDAQKASVAEMQGGVYLSWTVSGPVTLEVRKQAGYNAVISGLFVDR